MKKLIKITELNTVVLKNIQYDVNLRNTFEWFLKSLNLMSASKKIRKDHRGEALLLAGYAFELIFKSYIIAENTFSGKALPVILNSHDLIFLNSKLKVKISKTKIDNKLLISLSEYIVWKGRYPIPLRVKDLNCMIEVNIDELDNMWEKILGKMPKVLKDEIKLLIKSVPK